MSQRMMSLNAFLMATGHSLAGDDRNIHKLVCILSKVITGT